LHCLSRPWYWKEGLSLDVLFRQFEDFLDEAHRLKTAYASRITLLVGLETDLITSIDIDCLDDLLKRHIGRIEYIVGSIHHVNGIPIDLDVPTFRKSVESSGGDKSAREQQESFLSSYFDAQYELLHRFHPEIVGHLDLCRLYTPELRFRDYPLAWQKLQRNVLFAIQYGALFEVNAAAFNKKGWNSAYPAEDVAEVCLVLFVSAGTLQ
jgi:histidinol-phosphatase (PHP family)